MGDYYYIMKTLNKQKSLVNLNNLINAVAYDIIISMSFISIGHAFFVYIN